MLEALQALAPLLGGQGQVDKGTQTFLDALKLQSLAACINKQLVNKKNPNMMFITNDIDKVGQSIAGNQMPFDITTLLGLLPMLSKLMNTTADTPTAVETQDDKIYAGVLAKIKEEYKLTPIKKG